MICCSSNCYNSLGFLTCHGVQILIQDLDGARLLAVGVVECESDSASMRHDYPAKFAGYELDVRSIYTGKQLGGFYASCRRGLFFSLFFFATTIKFWNSHSPSDPISVSQSSFSTTCFLLRRYFLQVVRYSSVRFGRWYNVIRLPSPLQTLHVTEET